jgi:hypothetical protein
MEKEYIEMMIKNLNKSLVEVTRFIDEVSRKAIETQITMYKNRLKEIK